jgi:E3 ubiquitin-protein ligase HERC2
MHISHGLAVTQSGAVFRWGYALRADLPNAHRPILAEGFGEGVRLRSVSAGFDRAVAIGEKGEVFSLGLGGVDLGHGAMHGQPSPKRVEALRGVRVSSVSAACHHTLALVEDGQVYAWGENKYRALLGLPDVDQQLVPRPVEAIRGVRVGSVAAARHRSYAVADTGELWAWGVDGEQCTPLGHGETVNCPLPKPIESMRGIKVDAVVAGMYHTLAQADHGSVYAWGVEYEGEEGGEGEEGEEGEGEEGAVSPGPSTGAAGIPVRTTQLVPGLRLACWL